MAKIFRISDKTIQVTHHAQKRFIERFSNFIDKDTPINLQIIKYFLKSEENNSFQNNTLIMDYFYNQYGYERRMLFYTYKNDMVFVCKRDPDGTIAIVTVTDLSYFLSVHVKFKKKVKDDLILSN